MSHIKHLKALFSTATDSPAELLENVSRLFRVLKITDGPEICNDNEAYTELLQNWDKEVLCCIKEYRTLVLDSGNRPTHLISFPILGNHADESNIARLFELIKRIPDASKVIIAQNSPEKTVLPNSQEEALAKAFSINGASIDIPVTRHLIMSNNALYAFSPSKIKKRPSPHHVMH